MRVRERIHDLDRYPDRIARRQFVLAIEAPAQSFQYTRGERYDKLRRDPRGRDARQNRVVMRFEPLYFGHVFSTPQVWWTLPLS